MARFDVYQHPDPAERKWMPYLLDVQNSYLDLIGTRVVIPLQIEKSMPNKVRNLNPTLQIQGKSLVMNTAAMMAIAEFELRKPVQNLTADQLIIQDALDTLFGAY
ncbi:MAG: plasmid maintenance protein CcdB [Brachymonas sp.]|nr:plasmid maintenance protein CcdB [Brachymonas sp.]